MIPHYMSYLIQLNLKFNLGLLRHKNHERNSSKLLLPTTLLTMAFCHKCMSVNFKAIFRAAVKMVFLKISQNSQENTCASLFLNKVAGLRLAALLKKRLWRKCFLVNFVKFLRTTF